MESKTGGCLCRRVHYKLSGEPIVVAVCHCTHCQKQSGGAFSVNLLVQESQLDISGTLKTFADKGDSGAAVLRRFCSDCGSPIISVLGSTPGMVALKAGTLDDTSDIKPAVQIWCESQQNWVKLSPELPAFPQNPPAS